MSNFFKQPSETKQFPMDFANVLAVGETITSKSVVAIDTLDNSIVTGTIISASEISGSTIVVTVTAGTTGHLYKITIIATTDLENDLEEDVYMSVAEDDPLVVGTDTYISVATADIYVNDNYPSTATEYSSWNALAIKDKSVYLKKACKKIDRQILRGIKIIGTQILEFPRAIHSDYRNYNYPNTTVRYTEDWVVEQEVAQTVKDAQVEEAIALLIQGSTSNKRSELQAQNVKSYSLGNISETFIPNNTSGTRLLSTEAKELLRPYLLGSVVIR